MRHVKTVLSVLLGALLLWLLFRRTDWAATAAALRQVRLSWLALALALAFGSCLARVQRWSYVVRAVHPATFRSLFSATQVGLLVNLVVPARLGEAVRAYLLGRLSRAPLALSLSLVAMDRVNDGLALIAVLFIAAVTFPAGADVELPAGAFGNAEPLTVSSGLIRPAAASLTLALGLLVVALVLVYAGRDAVQRALCRGAALVSAKLAARVENLFRQLVGGMRVFRSAADLARAVFFSFLTWGLVALSLQALLLAFRLELPWFTPFLMLALLAVSTSVTVTPGLVGQYHIPVVASLLLIDPRLDPSVAKAVALVAHLVAVLPVAALGALALVLERPSLGGLARTVSEARQAPAAAEPPPSDA